MNRSNDVLQKTLRGMIDETYIVRADTRERQANNTKEIDTDEGERRARKEHIVRADKQTADRAEQTTVT